MTENTHRVDTPIESPEKDLFELEKYVKNLSSSLNRVTPPFTVGIYGKWGEGKTSFVNLLLHHIEQSKSKKNKPIIITFSAWPYNDSETLWKALIFKIAENLFDKEEQKKKNQPIKNTSWFKKEIYNSNPKKEVDEAEKQYNRLIEKINSSNFTGITKSRSAPSNTQDNTLFASLVLTSIEALTKASPFVAGIKDLIGLKEDHVKDIFKENKEESNISQIQFVDEFSMILKDLFNLKAKNKKMFVFIDDLDRCFPDVALDVLEAIKIFLHSIPCIFIVAVDQSLISQGLKMRFKDLSLGKGQLFFKEKGKEYIEKIIQLRINLPPRSGAVAKKFISAQFPRWTIASDIINVGVGGNPRRLIQHCNSLSFYYSVYESIHREDSANDELKNIKSIVDKILSLGSFNQELVTSLGNFVRNKDIEDEKKISFFKELDNYLDKENESTLQNFFINYKSREFDKLNWHFEKEDENPILKRILSSEPRLSNNSNYNFLEVITSFADIHVDEEGESVFKTKDKIFNRVLARVRQGEIKQQTLFEEDLKKIVGLLSVNHGGKVKRGAKVLRFLSKIASSKNWMNSIVELEELLINIYNRPQKIQEKTNISKIFHLVKDNYLRDYILEGPRLSSISSESFLLIYDSLIKSKIEIEKGLVREQRNKIILKIKEYLENNEKLKENQKQVFNQYQLRIDIAFYLLSLRAFAAIEVISNNWPEHTRKLREEGLSYLINIQKFVHDDDELISLSENVKSSLRKDDTLKNLLQLPPLFREIKEKEIFEFFAAANTFVDTQARPSTSILDSSEISKEYKYLDFQILFSENELNDQDHNNYTISFSSLVAEGIELKKNEHEIKIGDEEINDLINAPQYLFNQSLASTAEYRGVGLQRQLKPFQRVEELGARIFSLIFKNQHKLSNQEAIPNYQDRIYNYINSSKDLRVRIILNISSNKKRLNLIPWETLFLPSKNVFPALIGGQFSIVRNIDLQKESLSNNLSYRTFFSPLKILLVTSNPKDLGYLNSFQEIEAIEESLKEAKRKRKVVVSKITNATLEELKSVILDFKPHVLHYGGHATYLKEESQGALVLEDEKDGTSNVIPIKRITEIVAKDTDIVLAILNGCDTGSSHSADIYSSVAGEMVTGGVPVVIASTRNIMDHVSIAFAKEFYKVFADGYPVEIALVEARKYLKYWNWDWSAYSLFVDNNFIKELKNIRLPNVSRVSNQ